MRLVMRSDGQPGHVMGQGDALDELRMLAIVANTLGNRVNGV